MQKFHDIIVEDQGVRGRLATAAPSQISPNFLRSVKSHTERVIREKNIDYAAQNLNATCDTTEVVEQEQQKFISNLMAESSPIRGMVLWHGLGSGKTLTSIVTTRENNRNVVVFSPASLIGNYKKEVDFAMNNNLLQKPSVENYRQYFLENSTEPRCAFTEELKAHKKHATTTSKKYAIGTKMGKRYTLKKKGGGKTTTKKYTKAEKSAANALLSMFSPRMPPPPPTRSELSAANIMQSMRPPATNVQPPPPPDLTQDDIVLKIVKENKIACNKSSIDVNDIKFPKNKLFKTGDINTYYFYSTNGDLNRIELSDYKYYLRENSFIIFDESQLFISKIYNSYKAKSGAFYHFYKKFIYYFNKNNLRVLFLSGTPIVGKPAELAILFNMIKGSETLFDVDNFNETYALQNKPPPYEYSFTNAQREQQLQVLFRETTVKNADQFKEKTYGLLSYFGNIKSLLPEVSLDPAILRRSGLSTENLKYGYNNDGKPLFFIKECSMTRTQYNRVRLLDILIGLLSSKSDKTTSVLNEYLINFKTISYDFAIMPNLNIEYEGKQLDIMKKIYETIEQNPNITAQELLSSDAVIREKINEIKNILKLTKTTEFLYTVQKRRQDVQNFFQNYFTKLEELIQSEEAKDFMDDAASAEGAKMGVLRDYSCKIYEICKTIKENPDKKHIIYCESRRVNVILARALRAYCGMTEFMGGASAPSNSYMFLTGAGEDPTEDTQFKYYNNEGKLRVNPVKKEAMIDYFNKENAVRVVILNSAAAEGITLKRVNFVHLLQVPPNMSRLYQIVGRAIRNCTHAKTDDKTVTPLLYIATHPDGASSIKNRDIDAYVDIVNKNDIFLPYLNLLKYSSVDCELTKKIPGNENMHCFEGDIRGGGARTPCKRSAQRTLKRR